MINEYIYNNTQAKCKHLQKHTSKLALSLKLVDWLQRRNTLSWFVGFPLSVHTDWCRQPSTTSSVRLCNTNRLLINGCSRWSGPRCLISVGVCSACSIAVWYTVGSWWMSIDSSEINPAVHFILPAGSWCPHATISPIILISADKSPLNIPDVY